MRRSTVPSLLIQATNKIAQFHFALLGQGTLDKKETPWGSCVEVRGRGTELLK
jgi:hypothetical protein